jgi:hypothetical protein
LIVLRARNFQTTTSKLTERPGLGLVTESIDSLWTRTDESETGLLYLSSKLVVLRQETVTRVNHVDAMLQRDPDDILLAQVSADGSESFTDLIGLVGLLSMSAESVLVRVDGDG